MKKILAGRPKILENVNQTLLQPKVRTYMWVKRRGMMDLETLNLTFLLFCIAKTITYIRQKEKKSKNTDYYCNAIHYCINALKWKLYLYLSIIYIILLSLYYKGNF